MEKTKKSVLAKENLERSYDETPYFVGLAYPYSHIENLAALATVHGLAPATPKSSRVLELGCGLGGNLIAMAENFPDATFIGVDLSSQQILEGQAVADQIGLSNLHLQHLDILGIDDNLGEFDYIISHGMFSWVPKNVQDKILSICKHNLAPNGIAMVAYITAPGGQYAVTTGKLMHYHLDGIDSRTQRLNKAMSLLKFMSTVTDPAKNPYSQYYKMLYSGAQNDSINFYHEYLNVEMHSYYFHEFITWLKKYGLSYIGEALQNPNAALQPKVAYELAENIKDPLQREQYRDFIVYRINRYSMVTHEQLSPKLLIEPNAFEDLYICAWLHDRSERPQIANDISQKITFMMGGSINVTHRLTKAAITLLDKRWPLGLRFSDLVDAAFEQITEQADNPAEKQKLVSDLLVGLECGGIEVRLGPPDCVDVVSQYPTVTRLSRLRASQKGDVPLTNQRNSNIPIDQLGKRLVTYLDGKHDFVSFLSTLEADVKNNKLMISVPGRTNPSTSEIRMMLEKSISGTLEQYRKMSLLVG